MRPCVHPPRVEFLFSPVLWSSCNQAPLAFKTKCSGGSSSWCQTPRLGSLTWGSELSLLWENFCDIINFQFVVTHLVGIGFDCITNVPFLPSRCGFSFVFGCKIFFGNFLSCLLMVVQQLVVILVFSWEEVGSSPSSLPSCLWPLETY